jgi:predicted MFS family arabinose efflux permease
MLNYPISLYKNAYSGLSRPIWWLGLVMLVNRAGTMVIPFLTLYLREEKNFSIGSAGLVIAFYGIGAIGGNFIGGRLTDRQGFHVVQFWSLFLNGVLFIVLGQMQTFWQIAVCMMIIGIVGESFRPANAAAIAHYSLPENRTRSYSLNRLAINLGFSMGPAIGGLLAYQAIFWVDGITCMVAALILRVALPSTKINKTESVNTETIRNSSSVWKDKIYLRFMFFVFLTAVCFMQMFSMMPPFYIEQLHFSKSLAGMILALNGLIIVLVEMVMVYKLEGRRSSIQYISLGAAFIGLSYALLNLPLANVTVALIAMLVITSGEMLMFPFINNFWVSRSSETNRGQYASVYSMSFATAQVLAPTFGSQVIEHFGYQTLWFVVFGICLVASFGFSTFRKHHG